MTQLGKLHQKMLDGRPLSFLEFQRLLKAFGFRLFRIAGSHHIYGHDTFDDQLSIQPRGKDAKSYQVRQFVTMVQRYSLSLDD